MRIVMTIVGVDRVGIIAKASTLLAENNVNILNINQNIDDGFFNMVLIGEMEDAKVTVQSLKVQKSLRLCTGSEEAASCSMTLKMYWKQPG